MYNNIQSHILDVTSGSPQGGVLSPTLFNLYVHDLPNCCKNSTIFQYADDCAIVKEIKNDSDIQLLQNDLNAINDYCIENH